MNGVDVVGILGEFAINTGMDVKPAVLNHVFDEVQFVNT